MFVLRSRRRFLIPLTVILILALAATIGTTSSSFVDPEASTDNVNRIVANWYDLVWGYRKSITINNSSGGVLTSYQVKVTIDTETLIDQNKMQPDGDDIRFTSSDGGTDIPYWIESGIDTTSTVIWTKVPSIPMGDSTIYMYYGNTGASAASSLGNTFPNDGSFTDSFADTSKINTSDSANVEVIGGEVDIATKERQYNESEGESTTTSNVFQDKVTLTFTPGATKNYLIIASGLVAHASTSYVTEVQLTIDGSTYAINEFQPSGAAATNYYSFASHKVVSLDATAHTIKVQYRSTTSGQTAKIKNALIIAVEVQDYETAISETQSQTTSTSYQDKTTLTFTPASAGDYLIIATADLSAANNTSSALARLTYDGASQGEMTREPTVASHFYTFGMIRRLSLTAASHTFKIQYRSESGSYNAYIKNARITAVRISDLGSSQYAESEAESYTSLATYQDKTTLTFTPASAGDYLIVASALVRQENATYAVYANLAIDGTSYGEKIYRPRDATDYVPFFVIKKINLSAASHTIKIQYRTNSASTAREAFIKNARIIAIPTKVYYSSAILRSVTIPENTATRLAVGIQLSWTDNELTNTDVKYQLEYYNGSWALIPDGDLAGNSSGFDTSPVDISTVRTNYSQIRLRANLSTTDNAITPGIQDWTVTYYYRAYASPEPGVTVGGEE